MEGCRDVVCPIGRGPCLVKHSDLEGVRVLLPAACGNMGQARRGIHGLCDVLLVAMPRGLLTSCTYPCGAQASRGKFLCAGEQRAYRVKVRAQDLTGQPLTLTDWRARIFQHEFDHLQVPPASRSFTDCDLLEQLMCGLPLKRCMRMVRSKTAACLFV